jgi:hypothetical protein
MAMVNRMGFSPEPDPFLDPIMPPDRLYHYTNQQGLIGIIRDQTFWATKIAFLNDGRELSYGFDLARDYLSRHKRFHADDTDGLVLRKLHEYIDRVSSMDVFVASFTGDGDLLSQWRGYGRPGDCYSLGFPSAYLAESWLSKMWDLAACIYDHDSQVRGITTIIEQAKDRFAFLRDYPDGTDKTPEKLAESVGWEWIYKLVRLSARIKHPSFKEEAEWRLISSPLTDSPRLFRPGRHTIIPYHALPLPDFRTVDLTIRVGPTQHPSLAKAALFDLVSTYGQRTSSITESTVAFRDW